MLTRAPASRWRTAAASASAEEVCTPCTGVPVMRPK